MRGRREVPDEAKRPGVKGPTGRGSDRTSRPTQDLVDGRIGNASPASPKRSLLSSPIIR